MVCGHILLCFLFFWLSCRWQGRVVPSFKKITYLFVVRPSYLQVANRSEKISQKFVQLKGAMLAEFARQPRSLTELDRWKATELWRFLLYTGALMLQDVLSQDHCHHFLSTIGTTILLDDNDARRGHYLKYAQNLVEHFVDTCSELYGEIFPH